MTNQNAVEIKSMECVKSIIAEHKEQIAKFLESNPTEGLWAAACLFFASQKKLQIVASDPEYKGYNLLARDTEAHVDIMVTDPVVSADNFSKTHFCFNIASLKDESYYNDIAKIALQILCSNYIDYKYTHFVREGKGFYGYAKFLMESCPICECHNMADAACILMFKNIINYIKKDNLRIGVVSEPDEIQMLTAKLLDLQIPEEKNFYKIYNPNSGIGSYCNAVFSIYGATMPVMYDLQETDAEKYVFALINLYIHYQSFCASCHDSDLSTNEDYDYAISAPRNGMMLWDNESKKEYTESDVYLAKSSQNCQRKAIGVYNLDICYRQNKHLADTRRRIVSEDILESVILLPTDLFNDTSAQTVVIVVNKQKQNKGFVRFVDASGCCEAKYNHNVLNVDDVMDLYNSAEGNAKVVDVPNQRILEQGGVLYPSLYINGVTEIPEDMEEVTLGELLEVAETYETRPEVDLGYTLYREEDINENYGKVIKSSSLPEYGYTLRAYEAANEWKICEEDAFIYSGVFRYLKGCDSLDKTVIDSSYDVFILKSDKVKPEYLAYQLSSPYFNTQLEMLKTEREKCKLSRREIIVAKKKGINIRKDFLTGILNCKVRIHKSLDQQLIIAEAEAAKEQKELDRKRKAREASSHENYVLNMRQRKHAVAQVLNEILPAVENIEAFIVNHDSVDKNSVMSRRNGTTLGQYVTSIKNQLDKVSMMVDSFTNIDAYGVPERVELGQFLKEYCDSKINEVYKPVFVNKDNREWIVDICPKDLTQALDNLFTNAVKHGFKDPSRKNYQIRVEVSNFKLESGKVAIFVANNGEPASKSVSLDRMFVWGIGQGTGIGCSQVKEIVEYFDGEVSYTEYPGSEDGFECVFKIVLPLIID